MDLLAPSPPKEVSDSTSVCHQTAQDDVHSALLIKTPSTNLGRRPKSPPLLMFQPATSFKDDNSVFLSSENIHETEEEGGSSTQSSNKDGRLTPLSLFDHPHSPSSSCGTRSLSYFSYLGDNFNRSSADSPVMNIGSGMVLSCNSSSFKGSIPSTTEHFPVVFAADDDTRTNELIDYCTCMCCVKALFYHLGKDSEEDIDDGTICSCEEPGVTCVKRWGFLSLLTCCMPFLFFYAPLKGFQKATQKLKRRFRKPSMS